MAVAHDLGSEVDAHAKPCHFRYHTGFLSPSNYPRNIVGAHFNQSQARMPRPELLV